MKGRTGRIAEGWDALRTSFGFLPGVAMLIGLLVGIGLPELDSALGIDIPALSFDGQDSARSVLATIATATVSVAGLSFSVTVVAFTLASSQLSPRVLRSFRGDRLSQVTLAILLGTFIYCVVVLVRLGVNEQSAEPPNLSMTVAVLAGFVAFALFAAFVGHIVFMLQPSSVIAAIHRDADSTLAAPYPAGAGEPGGDEEVAQALRDLEAALGPPEAVECHDHGYLTFVDVSGLIDAAKDEAALVAQVTPVGSWVLPGTTVAEIRMPDGADAAKLEAVVRDGFRLAKQRTMIQDIAFPVRQLADIALKGLSPGVNDPTTAQNAMEELATLLVEFARSDRPHPTRVDGDGVPRFVANPAELADLVRLGFGEVRLYAGDQPELSLRLLELLERLRSVAVEEGEPTGEIDRQRELIVAGAGHQGPTEEDVEAIRAHAPSIR